MMIDGSDFTHYINGINSSAKAAVKAIRSIWERLEKSDGTALRDHLIDAVPPIVLNYCDAAAEAAAQFYEQQMDKEQGSGHNSKSEHPITEQQIIKNIRYCMGFYFSGSPEQTIDELSKTIDLHVKNAARYTMMANMEEDNG